MVDHPLVVAARRLADDLLAPAAAEVDQTAVPRSHLRAIADAGLLGLAAPVDVGGADVSAGVFREVNEELAGADAATWFVQAQHHGVVRMLVGAPSPASARYLPALARGDQLAGFAFSHLRRYPDRPVTASRIDGGWRLDGVAPWYTGWGLNDVAFVSGVTDAGAVVFGAVPAIEAAGLSVKARLRTAALDAAQTVVLALDNVVVSDDDVALVQAQEDWLAADVGAANANPAIFGVGRSAVELLRVTGEDRGERASVRAAEIFDERLRDVRARCYAIADGMPPSEAIDERLELRAEALEVLIAITSSLVAAGAGPAMALSAAAQRKAREALFLVVQAQTTAARAATLDRWSRSAAARVGGRA